MSILVVHRLLLTAGFEELNAVSWEFNKNNTPNEPNSSNRLYCCIKGVRPHLKPKAFNCAGLEYFGACDKALDEIELFGDRPIRRSTLERWASSYRELAKIAQTMGIPESAVPQLQDLSVNNVKRCRDHLRGMIASFQSSGL